MTSNNPYLRYYQVQAGGEFPVFRGGIQGGEGFGDFLRGVFRFIAPIALRGISTFASHALDAHQKGATLKDAARSALNPTISSVVSSIGDQVRANQGGSGFRRPLVGLGLKHGRPTIYLNKAESLAAAAASMAPHRNRATKRKKRGHGYKNSGKVIRLSNGKFASADNHLNF